FRHRRDDPRAGALTRSCSRGEPCVRPPLVRRGKFDVGGSMFILETGNIEHRSKGRTRGSPLPKSRPESLHHKGPMTARRRTTRRGTILVVAMWIIVILSGLLLVFARSMRVEALGSANRLADQQANAVER